MQGRLFNIAVALSPPLFVATAVLWAWGHFGEHSVSWGRSPRYSVGFDFHAVVLTRDTAVGDAVVTPALQHLHRLLGYASSDRKDYVLGGRARWAKGCGPVYLAVGEQRLYHERPNSNWFAYSRPLGPWWQISVSYWMLLSISLPFPLVAVIRFRRRRMRSIRGECPACGYSLTGNTSGVCPECGAASPRQAMELT